MVDSLITIVQTKVTNRTLLKLIKARLEGAKGAWLEELLVVL